MADRFNPKNLYSNMIRTRIDHISHSALTNNTVFPIEFIYVLGTPDNKGYGEDNATETIASIKATGYFLAGIKNGQITTKDSVSILDPVTGALTNGGAVDSNGTLTITP